MAYNITKWLDQIVQFPFRFIQSSNGDGTITQKSSPGIVEQQGTPQSADNFNNLETGVFAANDFADFLFLQILALQRKSNSASGEIGTAVLTNTQAYPFNDSGMTVALQTPRDTTNYFVSVSVVGETGGSAGAVRVSNQLLNGFRLTFDGSASAVTVRYNVTGGSV